jgi:hypothetical protein
VAGWVTGEIRLLPIAEGICDPAGCGRPGLCIAAGRRTTALQRLIGRHFKDASEAEKRTIVRENVAQLYGSDFD